MKHAFALCLAMAGAPLLASAQPAAPPAGDLPVPSGAVFHFFGMVYVSGRIEFRDPSGALFPNYWYENKFGDLRGRMVFDPQKPVLDFSLNCTRLCQPNDGMDLKVLGEAMQPDRVPPVRFTATRIGPWQPASPEEKTGPYEKAPIQGELDVDGRKVAVRTVARIIYNTPGRGDMRGVIANDLLGTSIHLAAEFTIKGRDLGLKKVADKDIRITVHSRAFTEDTILKGTRKKTLQEAGVKP
jgi:hypothetical protein